MIEKYLFVGALYLILLIVLIKLLTKGNFQRLFKKLSTMLDEGVSGIWSATRFIMVTAWALIIGTWAFISLWKMEMQEIPQTIVEILLISAMLKYYQKKAENGSPDSPLTGVKNMISGLTGKKDPQQTEQK